jgi:uncharacterized protein YqgC (DUF456 family)
MRIRNLLSTAGVSTTGVALVVVGIVGIFLPIIPGLIPIAAGMTILARRFTWADRIVTNVRDRLPTRTSAE